MGRYRYCPHCGAETVEGNRYCPKCGGDQTISPTEAARQEAERLRIEREGWKQRIENLEKAGRFETAAGICENLGMFEKAGELRRKEREITVLHVDLDSLIRQLAERGQTLTYHCCHCGAPLKIGTDSTEILKNCPNCGYSLEVIDLAKFINQHL